MKFTSGNSDNRFSSVAIAGRMKMGIDTAKERAEESRSSFEQEDYRKCIKKATFS
jgi:hypothetical protein